MSEPIEYRAPDRRRGGPPPVLSQADHRARRRARLGVEYGPWFDLSTEVEEVCRPLALRVAVRDDTSAVELEVASLTGEVHGLVCTVARVLATSAAATRTRHLSDTDRVQAQRALVESITLPARPTIDQESLATGAWCDALTESARPLSDRLSRALGADHRIDTTQLRRGVGWGRRLTPLLAAVDDAALRLTRRLDRLDRPRPAPPTRTPAPTPEETLDRFGLDPLDAPPPNRRRLWHRGG
ncbi:hypothetical protein [Rhodococcus koreensis]